MLKKPKSLLVVPESLEMLRTSINQIEVLLKPIITTLSQNLRPKTPEELKSNLKLDKRVKKAQQKRRQIIKDIVYAFIIFIPTILAYFT